MIDPAQFFKCLSDETRLYATLLIYQHDSLCVCELMEALEDSQPKISRHLAQLRNCGILDDTRRSQWVFYSISKKLPEWAIAVLCETSEACTGRLKHFEQNLNEMKSRPTCCI